MHNLGTGIVTVEVAGSGSPPCAGRGAEKIAGEGREEGLRAWESDPAIGSLSPGQSERLEWSLGFRPTRIQVDPGARLLQRNRERAWAEVDGEPMVATR